MIIIDNYVNKIDERSYFVPGTKYVFSTRKFRAQLDKAPWTKHVRGVVFTVDEVTKYAEVRDMTVHRCWCTALPNKEH